MSAQLTLGELAEELEPRPACRVCRRTMPPGVFIGPSRPDAWRVENVFSPVPHTPVAHFYTCPECAAEAGA